MPNTYVNTIGMRRLFTKEYEVKEDKTSVSKTGKIIINSQYLKDYIGKKVRIIIYIYRKDLK